MINLQSLNMAANDRFELIKQDGAISVYRAKVPKLGSIVIKQYELQSRQERLSFRNKQKNLTHLYSKQFSFLPSLLHVGLTEDHLFGHAVYANVNGVDLRKIGWVDIGDEFSKIIGGAIALNLNAMHQAGWVHGDFKFGNVMIDFSSFQEATSPEDNAENIKFIDIESAKKPMFFKLDQQARDVARFLVNAKENGASQALSAAFWNEYMSAKNGVEKNGSTESNNDKFKSLTKKWCNKFIRRHEKKYGSSVVIDFL